MNPFQEPNGLQFQVPWKMGLRVLFLRRDYMDRSERIKPRFLDNELRARYWILTAIRAISRRSGINAGLSVPVPVSTIGRSRSSPGDYFRYVLRTDSSGMESRVQWFEATEEFQGVEPKHVKEFMLIKNKVWEARNFDCDGFLKGLPMGIPSRSAQRRAADAVMDRVDKKLAKTSYNGMEQHYGYGTLVIGLPFWFAIAPADPMSGASQSDDFATRVGSGLKLYESKLKREDCPFERIVVVWTPSLESIREWHSKAKSVVYEDPVHRQNVRFRLGFLESLLPERDDMPVDLYLSVSSRKLDKKGNYADLPGPVGKIRRALEANLQR